MLRKFIENSKAPLVWIDIVNPDSAELEGVAGQYGLHATSVVDCLQPDHLPKHEKIGEMNFIIVRLYDCYCGGDADTVQKLTRKIAIFWGNSFIITVHRTEQAFLESIRGKWDFREGSNELLKFHILIDIIQEALLSYDMPLKDAEKQLDEYEESIFRGKADAALIEELYRFRRQTSIYGKMLALTDDLLRAFGDVPAAGMPYYQDLRETAHKMRFAADHLHDLVNNLLNTHLSLASMRTNEVMRVLTLFSVFFMPLTFIVGIYGMNFEHIPELKSPYGYPAVIIVMVSIAAGIYLWFKKKGWI